MQKILLTLLFLSAISVTVSAQADFRSGYVVPLSGDTIRGQVDYRGAQRNARLCRFRSTSTAIVTEYRPEQLSGYGFLHSKLYEVHTVEHINEKKQPTFLEILVKGKASLYFLRDEGKDRFLLQMGEEQLQELTEQIDKVYRDGRVYEQNQLLYQKTLAAAFQDCPAQQASLINVVLSASSLVKAVQRYNTCSGSGQQVSTWAVPADHSHLAFGLVVGAQTASFKISGPTRFQDGKYPNDLRPMGGLYLHYTIPNVNERLSLLLEALYEHHIFEDTFINEYRPIGYKSQQQGHFESSYLRVPLLVRYTFPKLKVQPFLQLGISNSYALKLKNEFRYRYSSSDTYSQWQAAFAPEDVRHYEQGLVAGIGLTTAQFRGRNLAFEVRAERGNSFNEIPNVLVRINRFYALLRYDLTK